MAKEKDGAKKDSDSKTADIKTADGAYYHGAKRAIVTAAFTTGIAAVLGGVIAYFTKGRSVEKELTSRVVEGKAGLIAGIVEHMEPAKDLIKIAVAGVGAAAGGIVGFFGGGIGGFVSGWRHSKRQEKFRNRQLEDMSGLRRDMADLKKDQAGVKQSLAAEGDKTRESIGQAGQVFTAEGDKTREALGQVTQTFTAEGDKTREAIGNFTASLANKGDKEKDEKVPSSASSSEKDDIKEDSSKKTKPGADVGEEDTAASKEADSLKDGATSSKNMEEGEREDEEKRPKPPSAYTGKLASEKTASPEASRL